MEINLFTNYEEKEKDDYIKKFFDAFTTDCTDRKIISILNEIAEKIEIIKK